MSSATGMKVPLASSESTNKIQIGNILKQVPALDKGQQHRIYMGALALYPARDGFNYIPLKANTDFSFVVTCFA